MTKAYALLILLSLSLSSVSFAQNLFPNPDFEQYVGLPTGYSGVYGGNCVGWSCIAGSVDYYNTTFYGISPNPVGAPSSGTGVVGMWGLPNNLFCSGDLQRESMMGNLVAPLEKCRRYRVSFDARLTSVGSAVNPGYGPGCLDFGFYFYSGSDPNVCNNSCGCWGTVTPQVAVSTDQIQHGVYRTFTLEFVASDNFDKVAIGPFCSDTMFTPACFSTQQNFGPFHVYINLDNISLIKVDDIDLISSDSDTSICQGGTITFTGSSLDTVLSWNWSIPNAVQTSGNGDTVTWFFPEAGTYDISVATQTACGSGGSFYPDAINVYPVYDDVEVDSALLTCVLSAYTIPGRHSSLNYMWSDSVTGSTRYFPAPGIYTVQVTDQYGCHTSADTIDVDLVDSFTIFPNPTNTAWKSGHAINTPNQLTLYDSYGRIILSESDVSRIEIVAPEHDLATGMYYLDITVSDCRRTIKLVLVN